MSLRPILTTEDPRLRQRAHAVDRLTDDLQTLIDDMVETMRAVQPRAFSRNGFPRRLSPVTETEAWRSTSPR